MRNALILSSLNNRNLCKINKRIPRKMSDFYEIITTVEPEISSSGVLKLYDIFVPLLGLFIISFNLLVVISSGLLLKKRKFLYLFWQFPFRWSRSICYNKTDYRQWCFYSSITQVSTIKQQLFCVHSTQGFKHVCTPCANLIFRISPFF